MQKNSKIFVKSVEKNQKISYTIIKLFQVLEQELEGGFYLYGKD